jgi:hypothetical protein
MKQLKIVEKVKSANFSKHKKCSNFVKKIINFFLNVEILIKIGKLEIRKF